MSTEIIATLITAGGAVLVALIGGLAAVGKSTISQIIATYKTQADATVDAKDEEIHRLRNQVMDELEDVQDSQAAIRAQVGELRQDIAALRLDCQRHRQEGQG